MGSTMNATSKLRTAGNVHDLESKIVEFARTANLTDTGSGVFLDPQDALEYRNLLDELFAAKALRRAS
jgi:hypothetical protein